MIKWIKNQYYQWMNRRYNTFIKETFLDYTEGKVSKSYYTAVNNKYKKLIQENLHNITL